MSPPQIRTGSLDVYLLGRKVGCIDYSSHRNDMRFTYDAEYLASKDALPLSYALPLRSDPFDSERTTIFFENLLPPDQVRRKLGPILHLSRHNVFGFLEALGGDCAGAISLWPHGETPLSGKERVKRLDEDDAAEILGSLKKRPLYVNGIDGYRISGSGAQNKLIARIVNGHIELPLFGAPSTHIIKPPADGFEDSVHNEYFCQRLAAEIGLSASRAEILELGGGLYYAAERYDREIVAGKPRRLHQEDFCQILSVDPEAKYESDGGPSIRQCMEVSRKMRLSPTSQIALVDSVVFNCIIGNADAHAKNLSIVYHGRRADFAPLYDLVSTSVYPELSQEMAMRIGGDAAFDSISRDSFSRMAEECAVAPKLVLGRLDYIAKRIVPAASRLADECNARFPSKVYKQIHSVIQQRLSRICLPRSLG